MKKEIKSQAGVYASPAELKRATMLLIAKRVYKFSATQCVVKNAEDFALTKAEASKYYLEIFRCVKHSSCRGQQADRRAC